MIAFLKWLFGAESVRKVILILDDGKVVITNAFESESGWIASWTDNSENWSVLLDGGKVRGPGRIVEWMPHKGWNSDA
jgi:hypothetical protein